MKTDETLPGVCERCGHPRSDPTLAITTASGRRFCGPACFARSMQDGTIMLAMRAMGVDPGVKIDVAVRGPGLDPGVWRGFSHHIDGMRPSRKTPQHGRALVIHAEPETELTDALAKRCGCGRHDIEPGADPYRAHREWCYSNAKRDPAERANPREWDVTALRDERAFPGIGISAPVPEPLAVDDVTGDDVARDMSPSEIRAWRAKR